MNAQTRLALKLSAAVIVGVAATAYLLGHAKQFWKGSEAGALVWFYDESKQSLYALPADTIPPHAGIGGKNGDGVRAVVVAFRGEEKNASKRRIAYLETYAPELKQLLEQARTARATRQPLPGPMPPRDSDFFQTNTLVKRPGDVSWHAKASAEGRQVLAHWRGWRGSDGQPPIVVVP